MFFEHFICLKLKIEKKTTIFDTRYDFIFPGHCLPKVPIFMKFINCDLCHSTQLIHFCLCCNMQVCYYEFTYLHNVMYVAHARKVDLCCINVILIMLCSVHNITCSEKSAILRLHWPFVYFAWSHSSCKAFSSLSSVSDSVDIIMAGIKSLEKRWITL